MTSTVRFTGWYEGRRYKWLGIDREEWAWALVLILGLLVVGERL